ncbi:MAG: cysteine desulfurase [Bacilli bacterium]|nr:cysteine desulfurase [Bacilli bacterium]
MIYLDYSATTPVNKEVLDSFVKASLEFPGNSNSLHTLGVRCNKLIESATKQIADIFKIKETEIIYTSGSSESNNLAIKGVCMKYKNRGKHIITTHYEHSSIYGPLSYLQSEGFEVDFVDSDEFGLVDLKHLESLIREDTILVSINAINSEIGILQPIEEIGKIVKKNPKCFYHVDLTQAVSKVDINLENVDLASFSAHKFFGIKGIGGLIKKEKIVIEPLIHGGKSTTIFRSGTPAHPLIVSLAKALRLACDDMENKYNKVLELNNYLKEKLNKYDNVYINSNDKCIPYILNISIINIKPETFLHALEKHEVYISTQTACSSSNSLSKSVLDLTKDEARAKSSLRISLSYLTTKDELDKFIEIFDKCIKELTLNGKNN